MDYNRYRYNEVSPYRDIFMDVARPIKWLLSRFLWDLTRSSRCSKEALHALKNSHVGEKAVILCNGPSLLDADFDLLTNVFTFGLNKINLIFDSKEFRPNCIVAVNKYVIEQNKEFYRETDIPLFLDFHAHRKIGLNGEVVYLHSIGKQVFARDCTGSVFKGGTVTYVALQLAFHMGFREVALIGCDHNFATAGPANKTVTSGEVDNSHFDPNYFAGGVKWQLPDLVQSEIAYTLAREVYDSVGGSIVNATTGGKLEIFKRMGIAKFLNLK